MKKIIITCLSALILLTAFSYSAISQQKLNTNIHKNKTDDHDWSGGNNRTPGTWDAVIKDGIINIQFAGEHWSTGRNFTAAELGTLPADKIGEFSLIREAGKMNFKGVFQAQWGHGTYKFDENSTFKTYLSQKGYKNLDDELMLNVFFTDINKSYFDFLHSNGYPTISNEQFRDLAEQDLNRKLLEDYFTLFKAEAYGHVPLDKIVELREHGVKPAFINEFHQMGYKNISLDKALELRDHGVTPKLIRSFIALGHKEISLDRAIELRDHGVNAQFIEGLQQLGYSNVSLETAQELKDHGVSVEYLKELKALGFAGITLEKAQELKDHGVSIAYIKKNKDKGKANLSLDDYIRLKDTGW
ncbi:hypothetical protein BH09BAC6_BH09BAC6_19400 [soil metagenome]|jgi:hypothetical protein